MNIAVFADVHGRVLLSFKLCARWQRESGEQIDLILQAGDLGAFFTKARLDRATRRFAEADPSELGFLKHFVGYDEQVAEELAATSCDMIFVRGNHEDHLWLNLLEQEASEAIFPVDAYKRIYCLKTGMPYVFNRQDEQLSVLGIGRIGWLNGEENEQQEKYIQPYEVERIRSLKNASVDILLTHDAPYGSIYSNSGIQEIGLALKYYKPVYHFFGHYGGPCRQRTDAASGTQMYKLADLHWNQKGPFSTLEEDSMGILRWHNRDEHSFEVVKASWLKEYTRRDWQHIPL